MMSVGRALSKATTLCGSIGCDDNRVIRGIIIPLMISLIIYEHFIELMKSDRDFSSMESS